MKGTKVIESILMLQKAEILELKKNRNDEPLFYYDDMKERNIVPDSRRSSHLLGTEPITEVKKEETDKDDSENFINQLNLLGTETVTKVKNEETDKDDSMSFISQMSLLGTETKTAVDREGTDKDPSNDELSLLQEII